MPSGLCHIKRLPEELLVSILWMVKSNVSWTDWWNGCMRTCRQWHRIGLGFHEGLGFAMSTIIESDVARWEVEQEKPSSSMSLITDFAFQPPSELYVSRLCSLTIHVGHQRVATPFAPTPGEDMVERLRKCISSMQRLTTFSLKFTEGWDFPSRNVPAVPQSMLARLVAVLPDTILDLELDTAGVDIPPSDELITHEQERHFCYQMNHILHKLRHLRLRTGHICCQLLNFQPNTQPCHDSCDYCNKGASDTCHLLRSWNMRTMTIWLPWGQKISTNIFTKAAAHLLDPNLPNPTTILLIQQEDRNHSDRQSITSPSESVYDNFLWMPQTNASSAIQSRVDYFAFKPVSGITTYPKQFYDLEPLSILQNIPYAPHRAFHLTLSRNSLLPEAGGATAYPFLATSTLEAMLTWTQRRHGSYRFPICESDVEGKMWFRGSEMWCCPVARCEEKCRVQSLGNLRGHVLYSHPKQPYQNPQLFGRCPMYGCDMRWESASKRSAEIEEHVIGHFRRREVSHVLRR